MANNKTVLILGGFGGIGQATAELLKEEGAKIYLGYKMEKKEAIRNNDFVPIKIDVTSQVEVKSAVDKIIYEEKKIDVVVYSVTSPIINKNIFDFDWVEFENHLNVQVKGFLNVVNGLKDLIKDNNKIKFIVILTEYCFGKPPKMVSPYVTAKYALMGLVKTMAVDLAKFKCTFNMVSPGMVETSLIAGLPLKIVELTAQNNPMGRIAKPKDVAGIIKFLASDEADYINGENILINGGNILK